MNYIDIIILIFIAFFVFAGFKKGLVRSIGGILGVIIALYVCIKFYSVFSAWLQDVFHFSASTILNIISVIGLFIVAYLVCSIIVFFIDKIFSLPILNFFNHLLGGVFGFVEGVLIIVVLSLILAYFGIGASIFENSRITPYIEKSTAIIKPILPSDLKNVSISNFLENAGLSSLENAINNLPENITNINDLITYLRDNIGLDQSTITDIVNTEFSGKINLSSQEIKTKLQEYLNKFQ